MAFSITLLFLFIFVPSETTSQRCIGAGDLGGTHCVLLMPYYSEYQWATCLTNDYITDSTSTRGKTHNCHGRNRYAVQCWYECMTEFYNLNAGSVNDNCRCSPSSTSMPTVPTLPPHCFSPRGDDCRWYRECLEVRYPCQGTSHGYAIEFAEKFCNLFSTNYNDFSSHGQSWVYAVRKCLQVELVPTSLRPWVNRTCRELRDIAFNSHTVCYLSPASGAPSVCDLSCADLGKSFWLVFFDGGALQSAPLETMKQMLDIIIGCFAGHSAWLTDITRPRPGCLPMALQTVAFLAVLVSIAILIRLSQLTLNLYLY